MAFSASTYILVKAATSGAVKSAVEGLADGLTFKGTVPTVADLPSTHNSGDMYIVEDADTTTPGNQGAKAVWDSSKADWILYDQVPTRVSQLDNDEFYLSSKVSGTSYVDNIHIDGTQTTHTSSTVNPHEYIISEIQFDRGTLTTLTGTTPKLGEPIFEYDTTAGTYKLKIGNGVTAYESLPYIGSQYELAADGKSVTDLNSKISIYGFATSANGMIPHKSSTGYLDWVRISDLLTIVGSRAIDVTRTINSDNTVKDQIAVKTDDSSVIVSNDKLTVPFDGDTIRKNVSGKWYSPEAVAGDGVKITKNATTGVQTIAGNYVAGTNVNITKNTAGEMVISSSGGSGGDSVVAGKAIAVTTDASGHKVISGNYKAGTGITLTTSGNDITISASGSGSSDTNRAISVDGTEILSTSPSSGKLNLLSSNKVDGVSVALASSSSTVKSVQMSLANKNIVQAATLPNGQLTFKTLDNYTTIFSCGGANFSN